MDKKIIFMLPGQGTQYYHMGEELFNSQKTFRKWMLRFDDICHDVIGESIIAYIFDDTKSKATPFDRTKYTHPAIFMVEYSMAKTLHHYGIFPDIYLGSSLGETTAAALTNAIDEEEAMRLVLKQARCFEYYCKDMGSMVTILDEPSLYEAIPEIHENCELASITFDKHFIVSGELADIQKVTGYLNNHDILYIKLPVRQGFHSRHINPAEQAFRQLVASLAISQLDTPMISCMCGDLLNSIDADHFWKKVRKPIMFRESITVLEKENDSIYIDIGPSGTFATYLKYILPDTSRSEKFSILTPFGDDYKMVNRVLERMNE
jgi:trans-AT polyketide synthase/acyltransferase/oxidoreductase domain-containing protein